jgi:hypothetical protein
MSEPWRNLRVVNRDMSRSLGAATRSDPARNAIARLDFHTTLSAAALGASLDESKPPFGARQIREIPTI